MKKILAIIIIAIITTANGHAQDLSFQWRNISPIFNNYTSNLVSYIDFGEISMWGYVEITLTYSFNNQLTTGMYGKRFNIGRNPGESFYANSSEVYAALGPVAEQWKLGEFQINPSNHLVLPIYHLASSGNSIYVTINGVSLLPINTSLIQITNPVVLVNTESRDYQHTMDPVGIGTKKIDPASKLTVGGKISAREIKVDVSTGADFVFDKGYRLLDLGALKDYIKINNHLPEVPAAATMVKDGLALGEFQMKLLQKIEELTLYLLQKEEQIKNLEKRLVVLEKQKHN
jgi:hypothetical protein